MNMDLETIKQALSALATTIGILKQAKDLLPENDKKKEVGGAIENAERQLKIAESQVAETMGYELCRAHFPPGIMVSSNGLSWKCQDCGNTKTFERGSLWTPWSGKKS